MTSLNDRAFEILRAEVQKCSGTQKVVQVQQDIVLKRLARLRSSPGSPASQKELRDNIVDIIPDFSEKVLKAAAKANRPRGASLNKIKWAAGLLVGSVGTLWLVNLPYPMIRWPVARTAPILLLPSYINMDYHYRRAVTQVEQADQLINQATSPADLTLGEVRVKEAQEHLDNLPVWFLGYWPRYTFWFGWQFTLDEFKSARANVGRMAAKVFQEKNAQTQLQQSEYTLNVAKQQYQQGQASDRETAIASWQVAIDQLEQIPAQTLAGRIAQTKLTAAKRDFERVTSLAAGSARTGTLIEAAQQFALTASESAKNPPHNASEWSEIAQLWEQAINQLKQVPVEDSGYVDAQKFLAQYQRNLGIVRSQLEAEQASVEALARAKDKIETLWTSTAADNSAAPQNVVIGQVHGVINQLQTVESGTTAYLEAQQLLQSAQVKLRQLQPK